MREVLEDGRVILAGSSTHHSEYPESGWGKVRADLKMGSWILNPISDTETSGIFI